MIPVGLILKGAATAANLLSKAGNKPVAIPDGKATIEGVKLSPGELATTPNKEAAAGLYKDGIALSQAAQPQAGGLPNLIGTIGGAVKNLLSTLNDDEWFGKYTGNGAAFNELLKNSYEGKDSIWTKRPDTDFDTIQDTSTGRNVYNILCPYAEISVMSNTNEKLLQTYMPSVIAYVRNKTNNVLTSNTDDYYTAFGTAIQMYMLYYHLEKLEKLALNVPQNVPSITEIIPAIQPINITSVMGMKNALRDYLKASVRLPYALTSYIRWRFGTLFMSANTKKAGLISYVPYLGAGDMTIALSSNVKRTSSEWIQIYQYVISQLKTMMSQVSRANADIFNAYSDHEVRYDVEDRHFDEKEFCLRQNYTVVPATTGVNAYDLYKDNVLVMDSRLDMNAAIQAVLISTRTDDTDDIVPFPVVDESFYFDNSATSGLSLFEQTDGVASNLQADINSEQPYGWYEIHVSEIVNMRDQGILEGRSLWYYDATVIPVGNVGEPDQPGADLAPNLNTAVARHTLGTVLWNFACSSLEMHVNRSARFLLSNNYNGTNFDPYLVLCAPLAFDYARLTNASVQSIQRAAMLNLTRGDYKRKTTTNTTKEVKEVIEDVTKDKIKVED